jgi:hypothetical protein
LPRLFLSCFSCPCLFTVTTVLYKLCKSIKCTVLSKLSLTYGTYCTEHSQHMYRTKLISAGYHIIDHKFTTN